MSETLPPLIAQRDTDETVIDLELWGLTDDISAERARQVLESVIGVAKANVDLEGSRATIWLARPALAPSSLVDALTASGFGAQLSAAPIAEAIEDRWSGLRNWLATLPPLRWPARRFWKRLALVAAVTIFVLPPIWVALYDFLPVPLTPLMIERWWSGAGANQDWTEFNGFSPPLIDAVIAGEDSKFCGHNGFDWEAIDSAMAANERGHALRGASTISMQTAKNAFLWPSRSWLRKGVEAYFTLLVETLWSKQRIMTVYLNVAEWGDGIYGAEAASQFYFRKSASALTPHEASLLAAVLPNPREWHVNPPGSYVQSRSAILLTRMHSVAAQGLSACVRN